MYPGFEFGTLKRHYLRFVFFGSSPILVGRNARPLSPIKLGEEPYFEKNAYRIRYDEYLQEGYPIATGVIEGACRHLVKDRMERSGMRWRLSGAAPMLMLRAIHVSNHWDTFQTQRMKSDLQRLHPNRHLIQSYSPETLAI